MTTEDCEGCKNEEAKCVRDQCAKCCFCSRQLLEVAPHPHLIHGKFQSDKYPTTPRGKVPLSCNDVDAQDLLWVFADRHRKKDKEFSDDLQEALRIVGYVHKENVPPPEQGLLDAAQLIFDMMEFYQRAPDVLRGLQDVRGAILRRAGREPNEQGRAQTLATHDIEQQKRRHSDAVVAWQEAGRIGGPQACPKLEDFAISPDSKLRMISMKPGDTFEVDPSKGVEEGFKKAPSPAECPCCAVWTKARDEWRDRARSVEAGMHLAAVCAREMMQHPNEASTVYACKFCHAKYSGPQNKCTNTGRCLGGVFEIDGPDVVARSNDPLPFPKSLTDHCAIDVHPSLGVLIEIRGGQFWCPFAPVFPKECRQRSSNAPIRDGCQIEPDTCGPCVYGTHGCIKNHCICNTGEERSGHLGTCPHRRPSSDKASDRVVVDKATLVTMLTYLVPNAGVPYLVRDEADALLKAINEGVADLRPPSTNPSTKAPRIAFYIETYAIDEKTPHIREGLMVSRFEDGQRACVIGKYKKDRDTAVARLNEMRHSETASTEGEKR